MGDPKKAYALINSGMLKFEQLNEDGRREVANYIKQNKLQGEVFSKMETPQSVTKQQPYTVEEQEQIKNMWAGAKPQSFDSEGREALKRTISPKTFKRPTTTSPTALIKDIGQGISDIGKAFEYTKRMKPSKEIQAENFANKLYEDKVKNYKERFRGIVPIDDESINYRINKDEFKKDVKDRYMQVDNLFNDAKKDLENIDINILKNTIKKIPSLERVALEATPRLLGGVGAVREYGKERFTSDLNPKEIKAFENIKQVAFGMDRDQAQNVIDVFGQSDKLNDDEAKMLEAAKLRLSGEGTIGALTGFGRTTALGLPEKVAELGLSKEEKQRQREEIKKARERSPIATTVGTIGGFVSPGVASAVFKKAAAPIGKFAGTKVATFLTEKGANKAANALGKISQEVVEGVVAEVPLSLGEIIAEDQTLNEAVGTFGENAVYGAVLDVGLSSLSQTAKHLFKRADDVGEEAVKQELQNVVSEIQNDITKLPDGGVDPETAQIIIKNTTDKINNLKMQLPDADEYLSNTKLGEPIKIKTIDPNIQVDDLTPKVIIEEIENIITSKINPKIQKELDSFGDETTTRVLTKDIPQTVDQIDNDILELENLVNATKENGEPFMPYNLQLFASNKLNELKEVKSKLRKRYTSIMNADAVSDDLKKLVSETDEKYYSVLTNKETWESAKNYVQSDPEKALSEFLGLEQLPSVDEVARGQALMQHYDQLGKFETAAQIADKMMTTGTKLGQAVQAQAILGRLTPEGMIRWANKQFDKVADKKGVKDVISETTNEIKKQLKEIDLDNSLDDAAKEKAKKEILSKLTKLKESSVENLLVNISKSADPEFELKKVLRKKFKVPEVTPELYNYIYNKMKNVVGMKDGIEKQREIARIVAKIQEQMPVSFWKKVSTTQAISHLLSVPTASRNIFGNLGSDLLNSIGNTFAVPFDKALSLKTGKRTVTTPQLKKKALGFWAGGRDALSDAIEGIDRDLSSISKYNLPRKTFNKNSKNILEKALSKLETALEIELKVPDEAFKEGTKKDALAQMMKVAGVDKPTKEMLEQAEYEALYRTFQDDSLPARFLSKTKETLNIVGNKDFGLGDLIIKYTRVPGNIMSRTVDFSPAGYLKLLVEANKQVKRGKLNQRQLSLLFGNATAGTSLMGLGVYLRRKGVILTPEVKEDYDKVSLQKSQGIGGYQINIDGIKRLLAGEDPTLREGDELTTYNWAQPLSTGLTIGTRISDSLDDNKDFPTTTRDILSTSMDEILDLPTLQVVNQMFYESQRKDSDKFDVLAVIPASGVTGFVPAPVRQVSSGSDPYMRDVTGDTLYEKTQRRITSTIPGLRQKLPIKRTGFGEKAENQKGLLQSLLSPSTITKYKPNETIDKLVKIEEITGETTQYPDYKPSKRLNIPFKQRQEYQKVYGETIAKLYDRILSRRDIEDIPPQRLNKLLGLLDKAKRQATKKAKYEVLGREK